MVRHDNVPPSIDGKAVWTGLGTTRGQHAQLLLHRGNGQGHTSISRFGLNHSLLVELKNTGIGAEIDHTVAANNDGLGSISTYLGSGPPLGTRARTGMIRLMVSEGTRNPSCGGGVRIVNGYWVKDVASTTDGDFGEP